jgi:hypothetical protein
MKLIKYLLPLLFLTGCETNDVVFRDQEPQGGCSITEVPEGALINCGDGDVLISDGSDGEAGQDGTDGKDAVILDIYQVKPGACTQVGQDIWIENIQNGRVFDVYSNDQCKDSKGEYCDNVVPVDDRTGRVDEYRGSGTVCWANNKQISGVKMDNNDIMIYVLEF